MSISKEKLEKMEAILGISHDVNTESIPQIDSVLIFTSVDCPNLFEAKDFGCPIPGTKGYYFRKDKPNGIPNPGNQYHWHIYHKGKECYAVNVDGTGHDGYHHVEIDKAIADFLRSKGANISKTNLIECKSLEELQSSCRQLLLD